MFQFQYYANALHSTYIQVEASKYEITLLWFNNSDTSHFDLIYNLHYSSLQLNFINSVGLRRKKTIIITKKLIQLLDRYLLQQHRQGIELQLNVAMYFIKKHMFKLQAFI